MSCDPSYSRNGGIAGILADGASSKFFDTKMSNVYIDGNLPLDTRVSLYIGGGAGALIVMNIDADCGGPTYRSRLRVHRATRWIQRSPQQL